MGLVFEDEEKAEQGVFQRGERIIAKLFEEFSVAVDEVFDADTSRKLLSRLRNV